MMSRWPSVEERFERSWIPVTESGCWIWEGSTNEDGYGFFYKNHKSMPASRAAYELFKGLIPDNLHVLHRCDVPACVNPNHLFLGTRSDNQKDCVRKGRHYFANKTHCPVGHLYDEENTRVYKGSRHCVECGRTSAREYQRRRRMQ
jgi:hypothetical protein